MGREVGAGMGDSRSGTGLELPRLTFQGREPLRFPGMIRALQAPDVHWPESCLEAPFVEATVDRRRMVMLTDPATVTEVLLNRDGQYPRSRLHDRILGSSFGDTLVHGRTMDWPKWRHAILSPVRATDDRTAVRRIALACDHVLSDLNEGEVDLFLLARHLALQALWRSCFCDEDKARQSDPLVEKAARDVDALAHGPLRIQMAALGKLSEHAVETRGTAFGEAYGIVNTALLFLHTGHDNVTAALTWALWLLARHPDIQERVREEWASGASADDPDRDLRTCPLTHAVIHETLRLYPPIPQIVRHVAADLRVGDHTLHKDFTAVLGIYAMHRNRRLWTRPDAFEPDRFMGDKLAAHRRLWLPFGTGPRGCVGTSFAFVTLSRAIGHVVGAFDLLPNPGHDLTCWTDFALRPHGRAPIRIRRRRAVPTGDRR